jgi:SAM-dependent methyltransferase
MTLERLYQTVLRVAGARGGSFAHHLDVGPGHGRLIQLCRERFQTESRACDYTETLMKVPGQKVDVVDLNRQPLPYADATFDLLTATEVVEHLEHYRETLREFYSVLKPGGLCILTTPNVLNLNSRLRYLWFGFANLFGPLPVRHNALQSTGGHINPVSYFYLAHALLDAGFDGLSVTVDRYQRSSMAKALLLWPLIKLLGHLYRRREVRRYHTIDRHNAPLIQALNSWPILCGRTIVVSAFRQATGHSGGPSQPHTAQRERL